MTHRPKPTKNKTRPAVGVSAAFQGSAFGVGGGFGDGVRMYALLFSRKPEREGEREVASYDKML